jgi:preprotein translocase subunit YajC
LEKTGFFPFLAVVISVDFDPGCRATFGFALGGQGIESGKGSATMIFAATIFQSGGLGSALGSPLLMMVIVMGIFYVMLILPQQRQRKKVSEMLGTLKTGDKVITNGGIYGTINGLDGDTIILKIAEQVKIRIARSAITQVETTEDAK